MKKTDADKNRTNIGTPTELQVFMFFSKKSSNQFGHKIAKVTDDKSGRSKKVKYTATSSDKEATEYKWPDKELIWSGSQSDLHFIGTEKAYSNNSFSIPKH